MSVCLDEALERGVRRRLARPDRHPKRATPGATERVGTSSDLLCDATRQLEATTRSTEVSRVPGAETHRPVTSNRRTPEGIRLGLTSRPKPGGETCLCSAPLQAAKPGVGRSDQRAGPSTDALSQPAIRRRRARPESRSEDHAPGTAELIRTRSDRLCDANPSARDDRPCDRSRTARRPKPPSDLRDTSSARRRQMQDRLPTEAGRRDQSCTIGPQAARASNDWSDQSRRTHNCASACTSPDYGSRRLFAPREHGTHQTGSHQ